MTTVIMQCNAKTAKQQLYHGPILHKVTGSYF